MNYLQRDVKKKFKNTAPPPPHLWNKDIHFNFDYIKPFLKRDRNRNRNSSFDQLWTVAEFKFNTMIAMIFLLWKLHNKIQQNKTLSAHERENKRGDKQLIYKDYFLILNFQDM